MTTVKPSMAPRNRAARHLKVSAAIVAIRAMQTPIMSMLLPSRYSSKSAQSLAQSASCTAHFRYARLFGISNRLQNPSKPPPKHCRTEEDYQHQKQKAGCRPSAEHAIDALEHAPQDERDASGWPDDRDDGLAQGYARWPKAPTPQQDRQHAATQDRPQGRRECFKGEWIPQGIKGNRKIRFPMNKPEQQRT